MNVFRELFVFSDQFSGGERTRLLQLSFKIITESVDLSEQHFLQDSHSPQDFHRFSEPQFFLFGKTNLEP